MKKIEFHGSTPSAFMKVCDGRTVVYTEDGDAHFSLPGELSEELVRAILGVLWGAFEDGKRAGRALLQGEFRAMMGLQGVESESL